MEGKVMGHAAMTRRSDEPGSILPGMRDDSLDLGKEVAGHQVIIATATLKPS
jgi:hypothetical protein